MQAFTLPKASFSDPDDVLSVTLFRGTPRPLAHALLVARAADDAYDLRLASCDPNDVEEPVAVDAALEQRGVRVTAVGNAATVLVDLMQQLAAHQGRPILVTDASDDAEELLTKCRAAARFCIPPRALADDAETLSLPPMLRPFAQATVYRVVGVRLHDTLCDLALSNGGVVTLPREAALDRWTRNRDVRSRGGWARRRRRARGSSTRRRARACGRRWRPPPRRTPGRCRCASFTTRAGAATSGCVTTFRC